MEERLTPVPLSTLRVDTCLGFDLFLKTGREKAPVLFRERNTPLTAKVFSRLAERKHRNVLIRQTDEDAYARYVEAHLGALIADDSIEVNEKADIVYQAARGLMNEVMKDPRASGVVERSRDLVSNTITFMRSNQTSFEHLLKVVSYDYYTYTHSVNVFVFSIALAQRLGHTEPLALQVFGEGALLHDVGKSTIDPSIVNSRGKLTPEEWAIMRTHPERGHRILLERGGLDEMALGVVRHHHEKRRGGGYPDGLSGDKIPMLARITTIADIFDALTTRRSYKNALGSYPALKLMRDEMLEDLDPDFFQTFVMMMANPKV